MRAMATSSCLLVVFAGCAIALNPGVPGSGKIVKESRKADDFHAVEVGLAIQATVTVGPKTSLEIEGDDNLLAMIKTEVKDGKLATRLEGANSINPSQPIKLTITTPTLDSATAEGASTMVVTGPSGPSISLRSSGAANLNAKEASADDYTLDASGASQLTVSGKGKTLAVNASGASTVRATHVAAESAKVDISGASTAHLRASGAVTGDVSGASTIHVSGRPKTRQVSTSGASSAKYDGD